MTSGTKASLDWMIAHPGQPYAPVRPPLAIPCELVLTFAPGTNGRQLNVRCRCMAGTVNIPRPRFWGYDPIGQASSIEQAKQLWRGNGHG